MFLGNVVLLAVETASYNGWHTHGIRIREGTFSLSFV